MQEVNVGIVGLGNVGSSTLAILSENGDQIALKLGYRLKVVAVCSRSVHTKKIPVGRPPPAPGHTQTGGGGGLRHARGGFAVGGPAATTKKRGGGGGGRSDTARGGGGGARRRGFFFL